MDVGDTVLVGTGHFLISLECLQNEGPEGDFLSALVNAGSILQIFLLEIANGIVGARRRRDGLIGKVDLRSVPECRCSLAGGRGESVDDFGCSRWEWGYILDDLGKRFALEN